MILKTALALVAAGAIATAGIAHASPQNGRATIIDLSAQQNKDKKKAKKQQHKATQQGKIKQPKSNIVAPKFGAQKSGQKAKKFDRSKGDRFQKSNTAKGSDKFRGAIKSGPQKPGVKFSAGPSKNRKVLVFKPKRKAVTSKRLRGLPEGRAGRAFVHGRNYSTWRGGNYRIRHRDRWRTFVPLSALAVLLVGPRHYYPYAYISAPRLYCDGYTEDGCLLNWEEVETLEGDLISQCVAYCPWQAD